MKYNRQSHWWNVLSIERNNLCTLLISCDFIWQQYLITHEYEYAPEISSIGRFQKP